MARDLERLKVTRHRYYLANKGAFKRRGKKWRDNNKHQLKVARELAISVAEAGALIRNEISLEQLGA